MIQINEAFPPPANKGGAAAFFYFIGNVCFKTWLVRAAQLNHCLLHNWELLGYKRIFFCIFLTNITNNKCCCFGSINVHSWKKKTICCLMWSSQLSPLASIPFLFVSLCRLLWGGLIQGFGSWHRPSSAKRWLPFPDYRYIRSGHRMTSKELPWFTRPASPGRGAQLIT